jgi:hypothetical protein
MIFARFSAASLYRFPPQRRRRLRRQPQSRSLAQPTPITPFGPFTQNQPNQMVQLFGGWRRNSGGILQWRPGGGGTGCHGGDSQSGHLDRVWKQQLPAQRPDRDTVRRRAGNGRPGLDLALLGATLWWLRRRGFATLAMGRKPGGRRMESLERLPLGPQQTLHLVRVGRTALLLASSPTGCALVRSFSSAEIEAQIEATPEAVR